MAAPITQNPQSYWSQAWQAFRRNWSAMFGAAVILLVITVGVFAPYLANSKPYFIHAVFEDEYDNSYFIVLLDSERLLNEEMSAADRTKVLYGIETAFGTLKSMLEDEPRERLEALESELLPALQETPEETEPAFSVLSTFESDFDQSEVSIQPTTRYPLFRTLTRPELAFTFFFFVLPTVAFLFRRKRTLWIALAAGVLISVAAAFLLRVLWPPVSDMMDYRGVIEAARESTAEVEHVLPPVFFGENENILAEARQPPTFMVPEDRRAPNQHFHLLGTDTNGRDVLSRMIYGARISMLIGIVAVSIYVTIGIILGAFAGYFGGWADMIISRIIEIVICFPVFFLILAVQAMLPPSILNIMAALGLIWWTGVARLQRGEFLRIVPLDFVQSVRALGGSSLRIIFLHVLPNALGPILVLVSFGIAGSILVESALSFLGFGVPQPTASWGDLLNNGRNDIQGLWWLTVFPGFAIFLTVTCFNLVGEGIRDALDPRREH